MSASSAAEALPEYQYNKQGTVRAPLDGSAEIMLDVKLVQEIYATPEYLATVGGQAAEARTAGFVLGFQSAAALGIETYNEVTGQWRRLAAEGTFAVVANLPE